MSEEPRKIVDWVPEPTNRYSAYGTMKVVCSHELEAAYNDGWRLVEIVNFQEYASRYEPCYQCSTQAQTAERGLVYSQPRFLVGKREDDVLAKLRSELGEMDEKRRQAEADLRPTKEKAERAEGALKDEVERTKHYMDAWDEAARINKRLENDIARIRQHFGEKAMREALDAQGSEE